MMCQRIGLPPISTIGLGRSPVSSLNREPRPPARMTAFIGGGPYMRLSVSGRVQPGSYIEDGARRPAGRRNGATFPLPRRCHCYRSLPAPPRTPRFMEPTSSLHHLRPLAPAPPVVERPPVAPVVGMRLALTDYERAMAWMDSAIATREKAIVTAAAV